MFEHVRKTKVATFVVVVLLAVLFPFFAFYVFHPGDGQWQQTLYFTTAGLIEPSLILTAALVCMTVLYIRVFGGLRLHNLGLTLQLSRAAIFTALLWALTQAALAIWQIATTGEISWSSAWREPGPTLVLGELISLFGNALYEEIVWRGFIFVQLFLLLKQREVKRALLKSLLVSQGLFALMHISFQLITWSFTRSELSQFLTTLLVGVILAVVYVKTNNLFIAVGFHALFNGPVQLFVPPEQETLFTTTIVTFITVASLGVALVFLPRVGQLWRREALLVT